MTADDSASVGEMATQKELGGIDEFPALPLPPGLTEKIGYKVNKLIKYFDVSNCQSVQFHQFKLS